MKKIAALDDTKFNLELNVNHLRTLSEKGDNEALMNTITDSLVCLYIECRETIEGDDELSSIFGLK